MILAGRFLTPRRPAPPDEDAPHLDVGPLGQLKPDLVDISVTSAYSANFLVKIANVLVGRAQQQAQEDDPEDLVVLQHQLTPPA